MGHDVNVQPGHGSAGRQPTREFLDTLSGHDDPGMFGRMFPTLEPLVADDGPLKELADAMKDTDPGSADREQRQRSRRLHVSRPVRRSRHHARPDLDRREGSRPHRGQEFPDAGPGSRLGLRTGTGRQPPALRPQSPATPTASRRVRSSSSDGPSTCHWAASPGITATTCHAVPKGSR